jgi:hypothetical protein
VKNCSQDQFLGAIFVYAATQASVFIKIIAVKICTAVDKEKVITEKQRGNRKLAIKVDKC